ncbi:hypothetical protein YN1_6720 [Nanoarchaeota archaeon]
MILDSSIIIRSFRNKEFYNKIKDKIKDPKITYITFYELLKGAFYKKYKYNDYINYAKILNILKNIKIIKIRRIDIILSSKIWAKLKINGIEINDADIIIAAMCINRKEKLLTSDKDFEKIKNIYKDFNVEIIEV